MSEHYMTDEEYKKVKEEYSLLEAQVKEFFDKDMQEHFIYALLRFYKQEGFDSIECAYWKIIRLLDLKVGEYAKGEMLLSIEY